MKNINDYASTEKILCLCKEILMPSQVTEQIMDNIKKIDFSSLENAFNGLFSIDTAETAYKEIDAYCNNEQAGIKALTVYLMAAVASKEDYKKLGISDIIYTDTMKIFSRFVNEHFNSYGHFGYDRGFWTYRCLSCVLFRIGELEYEMLKLKEDVSGFGNVNDSVISIHIPSDAILTREELDLSYKNAAVFLNKYYSDFNYKFAYCSSWLLSPILKDLLPLSSKILVFQSDYNIIKYNEDEKGFIKWVYKRNYDDIESLPETTSLARNIKKHLLKGGKIGGAYGILKNENVYSE